MRGKKGSEHQVYFLIMELTSLVLLGGALFYHIGNVSNDTSYWREYFSKDLAFLITTINAAQGNLNFHYTFASAVDIGEENSMLFEIATDRVNLYDGKDTKKTQPTPEAFAQNKAVTVVPSEGADPAYFEIIKTRKRLEAVFSFDSTNEIQCARPAITADIHDPAIGFSIKAIPEGEGSFNEIVSSSPGTVTSIPSYLKLQSSISPEQLSSPSPHISLVFSKNPDATLAIYYSENSPTHSEYLACLIQQELSKSYPEALEQKELRMVAAYDRSEEEINSFFEGEGVRVHILIPDALMSKESKERISRGTYDAIVTYFQSP